MFTETLYAYELDRRATEEEWPRLAKLIYEDVGYGAFVTFDGSCDLATKVLHNSDVNPLTRQSHTITTKPLSWNGVAPGKTLHCRKVPGLKLVLETKGKNKGKPKIIVIPHKL